MVDLAAVMAEHGRNVGFREGPDNQNPWGPEQGVGDHQAYCDSASSMVPWHHGLRWWSNCTYRDRGCAYTVAHVEVARAHGRYIDDHASQGHPASLKVGDLVFFDWNHSGTVDHVETVSALPQGSTGGQFETIGYNAGPNDDGCYRLVRDRTYLHGVLSMEDYYATAPAPPTPAPPVQEDDVIKLITCDPKRTEWPEAVSHVFKSGGLKANTEYLCNMNHAQKLHDIGILNAPDLMTIISLSPNTILELMSDATLADAGLARPTKADHPNLSSAK